LDSVEFLKKAVVGTGGLKKQDDNKLEGGGGGGGWEERSVLFQKRDLTMKGQLGGWVSKGLLRKPLMSGVDVKRQELAMETKK